MQNLLKPSVLVLHGRSSCVVDNDPLVFWLVHGLILLINFSNVTWLALLSSLFFIQAYSKSSSDENASIFLIIDKFSC